MILGLKNEINQKLDNCYYTDSFYHVFTLYLHKKKIFRIEKEKCTKYLNRKVILLEKPKKSGN